jgi:glycosyltransferase involved in cell wall biosynthesis
MLKFSIITVSYNSAATIRETIESVVEQDYPNIEYIVVDGGSSDGTQEIVKSYGTKISKFVSEKDHGLYDALNKGIGMSTGDIIGILHSDDLYINPSIVTTVANSFVSSKVDIVYGDLFYFKSSMPDIPLRYYKGGTFSMKRVSFGLMPPHPTFFIKRTAYESFGGFDLQFTLSADFDLILRFLGIHRLPFHYIPKPLVKMRIGGKSTSSIKRTLIMNREDLASCKKNGVKTNVLKFYLKYPIKTFDFLS